MARRNTRAVTPTVTTIDVVDLITAKLNELNGIEVARDAWEDKAPDQYGVVELGPEPILEYADGRLIDEIYQLTVTLYVDGGSNTWPADVRTKLEELETANPWLFVGCRLTAHEYLFDINKVRWEFTLNVDGPLIVTIESGA